MPVFKLFLDRMGARVFDSLQARVRRVDQIRAEKMGARLASLVYRLDKKHRQRTRANLRMAFPGWSEQEVVDASREVWQHYGRVTADFLRSPDRSHQDVLAGTDVEGVENLTAADALGKGVILVSAHYGNWERVAHWFVAAGYPITVVARDANQSAVNDRIMAIRSAAGLELLSRGSAARAILVKLKRQERVALLADQNAGDMFVPFFGKPCGTVTGPAVLSLRTGAPIVPIYASWIGPGRVRLSIMPALKPAEGVEPVESLTTQLCESLESIVRKHPTQWLWMHDRWKSARQAGLL
jgi:KDO2-lipid IV(A) lauroyltransferase